MYYVSNNVLASSSLCILSDGLEYDVSFVYKVLHKTVAYIKEVNPVVTKIHYFSDGCARLYKTCNHFFNLCHHRNDFFVDCVSNFFATIHGKSPSDIVGGTVKRVTAQTSLQRPVTEQVLSAKDMMKFC